MSPYGRVKRVSWDPLEKIAVEKWFKDHLKEGALPSLNYCEDVIQTEPDLKNRTSAQVKSYISNLYKKQKTSKKGR